MSEPVELSNRGMGQSEKAQEMGEAARLSRRWIGMTARITTRPSLSIVLPAYNEEALIANTLDRVREYLESVEDRYTWEILAINDGSRDRTSLPPYTELS